MKNYICTLTQDLERLQLERKEAVHELELIEDEIALILMAKRRANHRDSIGRILCVGDLLKTVSKGKYSERKVKITLIKDDIVTIECVRSKCIT